MIEADREYLDNPTLPRLCAMVAELIFRWERLTHESSRMRGVSSSGSKGQKSSELDRHTKDESKTGDKRRCNGCNRVDHDRDTCRMTDHPDFVRTGLWAGSATEQAIRLWERDESRIQLPWTRRADGTPLMTPLVWQTQHTSARPPTPPRAYPPPDRDAGRGRGGRDNNRRNDRREDETTIVEAMELSTSTPKTKVRLVGRMSSRIFRAIVVVLKLIVLIVNAWYTKH